MTKKEEPSIDIIKKVPTSFLISELTTRNLTQEEIKALQPLLLKREGKNLLNYEQSGGSTPETIAELLKRYCIRARYHVFQLIDFSISRNDQGQLLPKKQQFLLDATEGWKAIDAFLKNRGPNLEQRIKKRVIELTDLQAGNGIGGPKKERVGTSVILTAEKRGSAVFIVYGAISADHAGNWSGGRSNINDALILEFNDPNAVSCLLEKINANAKDYDRETQQNYDVIVEILQEIFPPDIVIFIKTKMFHRQEIQDIVELREQSNSSGHHK